MAKSENQKLKLLYLMQILQDETDEEHPLSLPQIKEKLAAHGITAERKSLYSDIDHLRQFGVDIEFQRGERAGYYVAQRPFQLPELKLLVDAVESSRFITYKKSLELISKIEGLASRHQAGQLQRQVYTVNRVKTMNESIYYNIDAVHEAITAGRKITFEYHEWALDFTAREAVQRRARRGGQRYEASPWALTWDNENYYLVAFDSAAQAIRHYRVDKMHSITVTGEKREGAQQFDKIDKLDRFDMAVYAKGLFGMFGGESERVRLRFENSLIGVVVDRFGKDVPLVKSGEEHFVITVPVVVSTQFLSWLFGFGAQVEVLEPAHLRGKMREAAQQVAAQYKE